MYSNILVPVDGSDLAEIALPQAQELAKSSGATVHLVCVLSRHPRLAAAIGGGLEADQSVAATMELTRQLEDAQIGDAEEYHDHVAQRLKEGGLEVKTELHQGAADEHIVGYARDNDVDLIVMSTHGHGGVKRMLLGSTTDKVIRSCAVPVLVIPCSD